MWNCQVASAFLIFGVFWESSRTRPLPSLPRLIGTGVPQAEGTTTTLSWRGFNSAEARRGHGPAPSTWPQAGLVRLCAGVCMLGWEGKPGWPGAQESKNWGLRSACNWLLGQKAGPARQESPAQPTRAQNQGSRQFALDFANRCHSPDGVKLH